MSTHFESAEFVNSTADPAVIARWPSEIPLFVVTLLAAVAVWIILAFSLVGGFYALILFLFYFLSHIAFVAHIRGSAVRLSPEQMPELHSRVQELSSRIGLQAPEAYLMQSNGALNAFATKLFRSNFVVLFSDLLDACGEDDDARDMIVGHELGHLKAGHLRWVWLLFPARLIPFLGTAYSRACEFTADRYGVAVCANRQSAVLGLIVLAAGGRRRRSVNVAAFVQQREMLETVWMTLGRWLSTHPPISERVGLLTETLPHRSRFRLTTIATASLLVLTFFVVPFAIGFLGVTRFRSLFARHERGQYVGLNTLSTNDPEPLARSKAQALVEIRDLAEIADAHRKETGRYPADADEIYELWKKRHPGAIAPRDPFNGRRYLYNLSHGRYVVWTQGLDPLKPEDDLAYWGPED